MFLLLFWLWQNLKYRSNHALHPDKLVLDQPWKITFSCNSNSRTQILSYCWIGRGWPILFVCSFISSITSKNLCFERRWIWRTDCHCHECIQAWIIFKEISYLNGRRHIGANTSNFVNFGYLNFFTLRTLPKIFIKKFV